MSHFSNFSNKGHNKFAYSSFKIYTMKIPDGYQAVMPYLIVNGAAKFIDFTKKAFNAVENGKHKSMRDENTVMHGEITIGGSTIMFADSTEKFQPCTAGLFVYVENADEAYRLALENGATSIMDLSNQSYGRTCGITDPVGNTWWVTSVLQ